MTDKEKLRTVRKDPVFVLFSRLFSRFGSGSDFSRGSDQIIPKNRIQIRFSKGRIRFMFFFSAHRKIFKKSFSNFR